MMRSRSTLRFSVLPVLFLLVGFGLTTARAEDQTKSGEVSARTEQDSTAVPDTIDRVKMAMEDFHQVMMPLWHESFPKQDYQTIREKAPMLRERLMVLIRVQPPAKLKEDEEKLRDFQAKRQELAFHVTQVGLAAKDGPDSTLASAFEGMHWAYEELEKVFAEPLKELESFHETLYLLWHKALPERDYKTIKETAQVLKTEADSLMKASLPEGCKVKKEEFDKRRGALKDEVYQLAEKSERGTEDEIDLSLKAVHDKFVELNQLFK
jgi:hypothetical protein